MNAPTAAPAVTTPRTSSTATADGVISLTAPTIESFLKKLSEAAGSESFSGAALNAQRAKALGFTASANCSYAGFVEAFRAHHPRAAYYQDRYPACSFLTWDAFHKLRRALKLSFDLPQHYVGAVPEHALTWMELFAMLPEDQLGQHVETSFPGMIRSDLHALLALLERNPDEFGPRHPALLRDLDQQLREVCQSFFVLAPPEVFNQKEDWIERTRQLLVADSAGTGRPVNDPLVVRIVRNGVLVVAAWGDEAAALNEAATALQDGIPLG